MSCHGRETAEEFVTLMLAEADGRTDIRAGLPDDMPFEECMRIKASWPGALGELARLAPRAFGAAMDVLEIGLHQLAELGQSGAGMIAVKQGAAQLLLERLDGPRQRRLRHVAARRRAREIELLGEHEKVPHLMHLHAVARAE